MPAMLIPGIIGISTDSAITRLPTRVSLAYAEASGVQNTSGAMSSQPPTTASAHCAQGKRRAELADKTLNRITSRPVQTSL
jgi:hypothetical protein